MKYLSYFFLFDKIDFVKKGISRHLAKIFESGELDEEMIIAKIATTTQHGAMQDKTAFGKDYFRELLERVRSIRASERRIWQQITDIFAECSIDYNQADHTKENMGLTTWKNAPDGRILKSDTPIAKNYLDEKQIRQLERAVTGYFDYIEDLIERENVFTMEEYTDERVLLEM